ncbi:exonuclease domain-containing protein [uncultured Dokdonia sp.]|uniref:exonuclease domain-containing protein n=1 Tax=uncultured Dokdonia sp. TaxID=575653 RepID=UPI00263534DE|nr:exonuclease domain-containing protein [uncultured Dokdonia sp.]
MDLSNAKYTIIDVETTGGVRYGRMTEICIITISNMQVVDVYSSLINPEEYIPRNITALTGITDEMVADAPKFYEIADLIEEKTKDAIFVAHNVNFDFGFLKKEFGIIGATFQRKKLCTVRLSRKLIPNLYSYSLGNLCRSIGISLKGAHRAEADTRATTELFLRLVNIDKDSDFSTLKTFLNKSSRQATLPPHIPTEDFEKLPNSAGIYIFREKSGKEIYVGKAIDIKKRVLSHIYSKTQKSIQLCTETYHLDYEETGNELTALLLEAEYIRRFYPKYNRAQKRPTNTYQIISYENQLGVIQMALGTTKKTTNSVLTLYNKQIGLETLEQLCEDHDLCPKYCSLQTTHKGCSHYKIKNCQGICSGKENVAAYNTRVRLALDALASVQETYIIKEKGRTSSETCLILVENGEYKGYGFIDQEVSIADFDQFATHIKPFKNTYHTSKIISGYMRKNNKDTIIRPAVCVVE